MSTWYFIRPTDTLFVRGNLAFGAAGEHGAGLMPPPPSVLSGALRSAMLGRDAQQLAQFVNQGHASDARLAASLGTPTQPGAFRLSWLSLAGMKGARPDALLTLPADLLWLGSEGGLAALQPRTLPGGVASSGSLPLRAVLNTPKQAKPEGGRYLRLAGLRTHLGGQRPNADDLVLTTAVHQRDPRLGIGLDTDSRTAAEGEIYTTEGHAFSPPGSPYDATGFLVGITGADGLLPDRGHLRLGGDGRSAEYQRVDFKPVTPDTTAIARAGRFRLVLQTPGLFGHWLPPGCRLESDGSLQLQGPGFGARLACAAVGRRDIVSGWDLHAWTPKPAQAAAPAGSVYWFDQFSGDVGKLADWVARGLRADTAGMTPRHAEGYNQAWLGLWPQD